MFELGDLVTCHTIRLTSSWYLAVELGVLNHGQYWCCLMRLLKFKIAQRYLEWQRNQSAIGTSSRSERYKANAALFGELQLICWMFCHPLPPVLLLCYSSSTRSTPVLFNLHPFHSCVIQVKRFLQHPTNTDIQLHIPYTPSNFCCKEQHEIHSRNYSRR